MRADGWVTRADPKPKLDWAGPQWLALWLLKTVVSLFINVPVRPPTPLKVHCGHADGTGLFALLPGWLSKLLTMRWPPKYGWLSGPNAVVRSTARLLLPTTMHFTELAGGTKKFGLIAVLGSPGLPSGLRHARTAWSRRIEVAIANIPSGLTAALVSLLPSGMSE